MTAGPEQVKSLAPYVSYRTLRNFLDSLKQGVPRRIDRSLLSNLSGAVQNQLLAALKYLSLVDDQNVPTPTLRQLVSAEGDERKRILAVVLRAAYPTLFEHEDFLTHATVSEFEEAFRATGAKGDTIRKNETFFLNAAEDAGIPIHARLKKAAAQVRTPTTRTHPSPPLRKAALPKPNGQVPAASSERAVSEQQSPNGSAKTITFSGGGSVTLTIAVDLFELDEDETQFVLDLRRKFRDYEQAVAGRAAEEQEEEDYGEEDDEE